MIGHDEIRRAVLDLHADPREIEETIRALGVDPDEAAILMGAAARAANETFEDEEREILSEAEQIHTTKLVLVGFVIGLAVGREAAYEEAPA